MRARRCCATTRKGLGNNFKQPIEAGSECSAVTAFLKSGRLERLGRALLIGGSRHHCAPPLHPRSNATRSIVPTSDTSKDPTQPNRLEKNANTAQQFNYACPRDRNAWSR